METQYRHDVGCSRLYPYIRQRQRSVRADCRSNSFRFAPFFRHQWVLLLNISIELERKQVNFVEFIESLAEYLKSEDVIVRSKALHYLSRVLAYLPSNFLSRQQTLVMTEFLCDRIHDGGAVSGLQVLLGMPRFNGTFAVMTVQA